MRVRKDGEQYKQDRSAQKFYGKDVPWDEAKRRMVAPKAVLIRCNLHSAFADLDVIVEHMDETPSAQAAVQQALRALAVALELL